MEMELTMQTQARTQAFSLERFFEKYRTILVLAVVAVLHLFVLFYFKFALPATPVETADEYAILKLVDIEEYVPPPPPPAPVVRDEQPIVVQTQPTASENIIETEKQIVETAEPVPVPVQAVVSNEPVYVAQHKISQIPVIPTKDILAKIQYPPLALRQGIEAVVYLELFIDQAGNIRRIEVLKDPGYGFAEAAIAAIDGMKCEPALANDSPVAVRFRYPVRFSLK